MDTFRGASHLLDQAMIDEAWIADAEILYLEGYLWDPELSRAAMRRAIDVSHAAGRKVAFTLSDAFIIDRHGADFRALRSEEHTSELQSLMRISYAVFFLKKKNKKNP